MILTRKSIPRRTFLRGAGTALALPFLDAMVPALAPAQSLKRPVRMAFVYVPNGMDMRNFTLDYEGPLGTLSPTLQPLAPFKKDITILGNLTLLVSKGAMEDIFRRQQKGMEEKVEQGSMTAAQASRGMEQMRGMSPMIFVAIGAVIASIFTLLSSVFWALVVFLGARFLGGQRLSFAKSYEIAGMAFIVACLAGLVAAGLILGMIPLLIGLVVVLPVLGHATWHLYRKLVV